jgi:hypothetical protein
MDFFIKTKSTRPHLIMELIKDGRNDYRKFHDMIQDADIFFNMYDAENGTKRISMKPATCKLKESNCDTDYEEYFITYEWDEKDTKKSGTFIGEFVIKFNDGTILKTPIRDELYIHIKDGYIKK